MFECNVSMCEYVRHNNHAFVYMYIHDFVRLVEARLFGGIQDFIL